MMNERFLRNTMFWGYDSTAKLNSSHVAVVGIGGVGGYAAEALARSGVGSLTLVDNDIIGISNCNRQLVALNSTLGQYKADVMAERVKDINPQCSVRSLRLYYSADTRDSFFDTDYDYIVDCIDLVSCKLDLIQSAMERNIPIISAMGTGNKLDLAQLTVCDISKTINCSLARVMRKELRARGIKHHRVVYSPELPISPLELEAPPPGRRSIPASLPWVPSAAGLLLASSVVRSLLNI